jgi:hypothetical protein
MRFASIAPLCAAALVACGQADVGQASRNAAWAAVQAADPQLAAGLRAAQTLRAAAAHCGWTDVDAASMARVGVARIEDPIARAAAGSLVEDLIVGAPAQGASAQPASDCAPETRRALEAQIASFMQAEGGELEAGEGN